MAGQLAYVQRMIELGYFNHICSTQIDMPMAMAAIDAAAEMDAQDARRAREYAALLQGQNRVAR